MHKKCIRKANNMKKKILIAQSSGNVFADLAVAHPEEALAKAELASQIGKVIKSKGITQLEAGKMLGLDQPKISALMNGKLTGFSLERLFRFLNELGQDVTITVHPKPLSRKKAYLNVTIAALSGESMGKNS